MQEFVGTMGVGIRTENASHDEFSFGPLFLQKIHKWYRSSISSRQILLTIKIALRSLLQNSDKFLSILRSTEPVSTYDAMLFVEDYSRIVGNIIGELLNNDLFCLIGIESWW